MSTDNQKYYTLAEIKLKMVNYCVYQDRCHKEVEQKFRDFILVQEAKEEIMLYLLKENYLNEERFTRSYIRGKFYQKGWGRNKIISQLRFKGITQKLIQKCMDEIDGDDYQSTLSKLYRDYFSKQNGLSGYQKRSRTINYLLSKGYEYAEITDIAKLE